MEKFVNNAPPKIFILIFFHLQFWGCSFFQSNVYPDFILIEGNDQLSIQYEYGEKRIIGFVDTGEYHPDAFIFAVFHRGDLTAPIMEKMFFPGDSLRLIISENHLNGAPDGNLAVLKVLGGDFQQEEITFSYSRDAEIILPSFQLHKVPYYYEKKSIKFTDPFEHSALVDSGGFDIFGFVESYPKSRFPARGEDRNLSLSVDSISIDPTPTLSFVRTFVESHPKNAELFIDNQLQGKTPINIPALPKGIHQFKVVLKHYAPFEKVLDIQPSKSVKIGIRLTRLNTINFASKEEGLKYILDDKHEWQVKKIKLKIESGNHTLKVYKNNELIDEMQLNITWNQRLIYTPPESISDDK